MKLSGLINDWLMSKPVRKTKILHMNVAQRIQVITWKNTRPMAVQISNLVNDYNYGNSG